MYYDTDDPPHNVKVGRLFSSEQWYIFKVTWPTQLAWMLVYFAIILVGYSILGYRLAKAHEMHGVSPEYRKWAQNAETTVEARKRLPYSKCCNHAEVFRTQFRVSKTDGGDEWYYLIGGDWKRIPKDIIHPHDVHAPDGRPTLFIYNGTLTCFFLGESGI